MAQNKTGTFVHVHSSEGGPAKVVAPGEDFPSGYEAAKDLTTAPDEEEDLGIPGPSQFPADLRRGVAPSDINDAWKGWKVPDLRSALGEGNYEDGDRKDALVEKATAAGIDPASKPSA